MNNGFITKALMLSLALLLGACGGGSNNPPPTGPATGATISGTAQAPSDSIAHLEVHKPMMLSALDFLIPPSLAAVTGLAPVANATVELVRIDDDGNKVGAVLATTTTDASGGYTLELPAGVTASADLVVQINNSSRVPVLRAIVAGDTVNIDPVSQFILNSLINEPGLVLASIDFAAVQTLVQQVAAIDIDFSLVISLEDAASTVDGNSEISQAVIAVAGGGSNSLIAGAWGTGDANAPGMMVFYADGAYINYQTDPQDCPVGGIEYGSYSFDGSNLTVTPASDQNGQCGLKGIGDSEEASYTVNIVNDGDQLDLISFDPDTQSNETASFPRVSDGNPDSIVGAWDIHTSEHPDTGLVFYPNGGYIVYQAVGADPNCTSGGVEYGTYSFDGSTISGNILRDDNQSCGLGEGTGGFSVSTVTAENNVLTGHENREIDQINRVGSSGSSTGKSKGLVEKKLSAE